MEKEFNEMLTEDNNNMREVGNDLAICALRVIKNYDGLHRLSLAVSRWAKTIGNEGLRKKLYTTK